MSNYHTLTQAKEQVTIIKNILRLIQDIEAKKKA